MDWLSITIIVVLAAAWCVARWANPKHLRNKGLICSMQPKDPDFTAKGADLKSESSLRDAARGSGSGNQQDRDLPRQAEQHAPEAAGDGLKPPRVP